eukprot:9438402-Alexandrium_andersonii.AAC.1
MDGHVRGWQRKGHPPLCEHRAHQGAISEELALLCSPPSRALGQGGVPLGIGHPGAPESLLSPS